MEKLITPFGNNHFFGYYDKSPLNEDKNILLSHKVNCVGKKIKKKDSAEICITDISSGITRFIDSTLAWNYQQGSQLQWLTNQNIIFNFFNKEYLSKIYSLEKLKTLEILRYPIYSVSSDKKIFSSLDYSRIQKFRYGYGYSQKEYVENNCLLKIVKTENSKVILELNKEDFKEYNEIKFRNCWVDHVLFSPSSYDFVFLLRYLNSRNDLSSYLFFYDFNKKKYYNVLDTGMAGHGSWADNNNFVIWGRKKSFTKKISTIDNVFLNKIISVGRKIDMPSFIRKNIYGDSYIQFNKNNRSKKYLNLKIPTDISGGHFSFFKKNLMISDTYHNEKCESVLFSYNIKREIIKKFSKYKCLKNIKDKSFRCDLHPRIISKNEVIIDSTHEGFRGVYKIKL
jgi:hypothetical protein